MRAEAISDVFFAGRNILVRLRGLAVVGVLAVGLIALAMVVGGDRVGAHSANLERGLRGFHQVSVANGKLKPTKKRSFRGRQSARATYRGGGGNGYARGVFNLNWRPGTTVTYQAAFFLPRGFHRRMQGQVALMRWDNWPARGSAGDTGGIVINGSDKRARLIRGGYSGSQTQLGRAFRLREGRWFRLKVRQRFSRKRPVSRVWLNGRRVTSSRKQNFGGERIQRLRFGIVAIAAGAQRKSLRLFFDEARARRAR